MCVRDISSALTIDLALVVILAASNATFCYNYADVIGLISPSWRSQLKLLDKMCSDVASAHYLKFNVAKCVTVISQPTRAINRVIYIFPNPVLSGFVLKVVDSCRYLGHAISSVDDDNTNTLQQSEMSAVSQDEFSHQKISLNADSN
jgi:hypothetical protein